jgi:hypothetical protein
MQAKIQPSFGGSDSFKVNWCVETEHGGRLIRDRVLWANATSTT